MSGGGPVLSLSGGRHRVRNDRQASAEGARRRRLGVWIRLAGDSSGESEVVGRDFRGRGKAARGFENQCPGSENG
jgi:hypothetical protein